MHTTPSQPSNGDPQARTANLLGALALEVLGAQERAIGDALGQRGAAAGALVTIHKYPDRSVEELREPLRLSQPGAARLVDRLVRSGWVERAGPGGRRGLQLRLTPAGDEMFDRLLRARRAALDELLEPLADADREQLDG